MTSIEPSLTTVVDFTSTTGEADSPFVYAKLPLWLYELLRKRLPTRAGYVSREEIGAPPPLSDARTFTKGTWTAGEDALLVELVKKHGVRAWTVIAAQFQNRQGKQCRERYLNHLDPALRRDKWEPWEDALIISERNTNGTCQWAQLARLLPGRTANAVKNRWNATLNRRLQKGEISSAMMNPQAIKEARSRSQSACAAWEMEYGDGGDRCSDNGPTDQTSAAVDAAIRRALQERQPLRSASASAAAPAPQQRSSRAPLRLPSLTDTSRGFSAVPVLTSNRSVGTRFSADSLEGGLYVRASPTDVSPSSSARWRPLAGAAASSPRRPGVLLAPSSHAAHVPEEMMIQTSSPLPTRLRPVSAGDRGVHSANVAPFSQPTPPNSAPSSARSKRSRPDWVGCSSDSMTHRPPSAPTTAPPWSPGAPQLGAAGSSSPKFGRRARSAAPPVGFPRYDPSSVMPKPPSIPLPGDSARRSSRSHVLGLELEVTASKDSQLSATTFTRHLSPGTSPRSSVVTHFPAPSTSSPRRSTSSRGRLRSENLHPPELSSELMPFGAIDSVTHSNPFASSSSDLHPLVTLGAAPTALEPEMSDSFRYNLTGSTLSKSNNSDNLFQ